MPKNIKVVIGGKSYDFDKIEEAAQLQSILLPVNWPIAKRDGVRLFLNQRDMLTHEFQRHFAANYKKMVRAALEQQEDGEGASIPVSFAFEVNFSALTVAAIGKTKMGGAQKFGTTGKPKSHDIAQGDFYADISDSLDTAKLEAESEPEEKPEKEKPEKKTSRKKPEKKEAVE